MTLAAHPFGSTITENDLQQIFGDAKQWEEKYRQLILLGKKLPALDDGLKTPDIEVPGCENRVWLGHQRQPDGTLHFYGDSEGRIVRGLLAVLLTAVEGQSPQRLAKCDPLALFEALGLQGQLSASRTQGLTALVNAVKRAAEQA